MEADNAGQRVLACLGEGEMTGASRSTRQARHPPCFSRIRCTRQPARRKAEPGNQETVTIREIAISIIVTSAAFELNRTIAKKRRPREMN
jgi:hypothetical protein